MAEIIPFSDLMKVLATNSNLLELTDQQEKIIKFINARLNIFAQSGNIMLKQKVTIPNLGNEDDVIRVLWEYRLKEYTVKPIISSLMWGLEFNF